MSPPWKNGRPKARVLDLAMTVLSRSKNAAARVTRHDCKWSGTGRVMPRAVHTRSGHPQFAAGSGDVCPSPGGVGGVSALRTTSTRPLVVSSDEDLVDDLLRL